MITYSVNHIFATSFAVYVIHRFEPRDYLGLAEATLLLNLLVTFLALEIARYGIHVVMHKIPVLWRFHAVHHSDNEVDVSTSFRHHPIEVMLNAIPVTALVWLVASSPEALILYRAWDLIMTVFTHTNVKIPLGLERWLRYLVVTPAFHRTHHFSEKHYTDSNYSATVPWLDYLFSTYQRTSVEQQSFSKLGLDMHTVNEQRLDGMILAPVLERSNQPE
ncbi:sterol desaturase family protein [Candidatus Seongchinamella marina]|uniref:sterol desaturase family protein n=1 Tax=Candidatus Seongchinamella marina TaxID=2518990 RepID=UPI00242EAA50|nr:sterol desaturase family protein [Candidatus Seongchinamella marina]